MGVKTMNEEVKMKYDGKEFLAILKSSGRPQAWVVFAHGSGSTRLSPRNQWVANELVNSGFGIMLFDLLSKEEDEIYMNRFDISLLAHRLMEATSWLQGSSFYQQVPIAFFGASTGAAAALVAAARIGESASVFAVVSRGGRPDLAGLEFLNQVFVPTLLIVGNHDTEVIRLNELALEELPNAKLVLVPGATHLFEEPGTLAEVVKITTEWLHVNLNEFSKKSEGEKYN
jgi:pimeloyl-ACP methyl ester carboxylesterase